MAQNLHNVVVGERGDGKFTWVAKIGDDVVASDANQGYENRKDALQAFFGLFFGIWDESFLTLYGEWQSYAGTAYDVPEGAAEGVPVRLDPITAAKAEKDADAPNYEAEAPTSSEGIVHDVAVASGWEPQTAEEMTVDGPNDNLKGI